MIQPWRFHVHVYKKNLYQKHFFNFIWFQVFFESQRTIYSKISFDVNFSGTFFFEEIITSIGKLSNLYSVTRKHIALLENRKKATCGIAWEILEVLCYSTHRFVFRVLIQSDSWDAVLYFYFDTRLTRQLLILGDIVYLSLGYNTTHNTRTLKEILLGNV